MESVVCHNVMNYVGSGVVEIQAGCGIIMELL